MSHYPICRCNGTIVNNRVCNLSCLSMSKARFIATATRLWDIVGIVIRKIFFYGLVLRWTWHFVMLIIGFKKHVVFDTGALILVLKVRVCVFRREHFFDHSIDITGNCVTLLL